jgi:hypothetical protein
MDAATSQEFLNVCPRSNLADIIRRFQGHRGFVVLCYDLLRRRHSLRKGKLITSRDTWATTGRDPDDYYFEAKLYNITSKMTDDYLARIYLNEADYFGGGLMLDRYQETLDQSPDISDEEYQKLRKNSRGFFIQDGHPFKRGQSHNSTSITIIPIMYSDRETLRLGWELYVSSGMVVVALLAIYTRTQYLGNSKYTHSMPVRSIVPIPSSRYRPANPPRHCPSHPI